MTNKLDINKSIFTDAVMGDKHVYPEVLHPLEKAIQSIKEKIQEEPELEGIIEELAEYTTNRPDREIVGVEAKLIAGAFSRVPWPLQYISMSVICWGVYPCLRSAGATD